MWLGCDKVVYNEQGDKLIEHALTTLWLNVAESQPCDKVVIILLYNIVTM